MKKKPSKFKMKSVSSRKVLVGKRNLPFEIGRKNLREQKRYPFNAVERKSRGEIWTIHARHFREGEKGIFSATTERRNKCKNVLMGSEAS
jgi:hypothetical protein